MAHGLRLAVTGFLCLSFASACSSSSTTSPGTPTAPLEFTSFPLLPGNGRGGFAVSQAGYRPTSNEPIQPYIWFFSSERQLDVFAPAGGIVESLTTDPLGYTEWVVGGHGERRFYLRGLGLSFTAGPGAVVSAGDRVGTRSVADTGVGLGVWSSGVSQPFVRPSRYPARIQHAESPIPYFRADLRSQVETLLAGQGEWRVNYDVAGRLQGLWFAPDVPLASSTQPEFKPGWLWFVERMTGDGPRLEATAWHPSINTYFPFAAETGPSPADVSTASGIVDFRFPYSASNHVVLRVQMLDAETVRAEIFDSSYGVPSGFTSAARTFIR
jgi:hypothetical protein